VFNLKKKFVGGVEWSGVLEMDGWEKIKRKFGL